jgi:hypothetical protein
MLANKYTPEQAAENFGLPLEVIEEAIEYYKENEDMIADEFLEEKKRLEKEGHLCWEKSYLPTLPF